METLVKVENNQVVVSSRQIAEHFEKRHDHVMRDIKSLIKGIPSFGDTPKLFFETTYINEQNKQEYKEYGEYFHDKSRYSNKEVESFRYYENAIEALKGYLG